MEEHPPGVRPAQPGTSGTHRGIALALVVLATVTGLLMAFGIWAKRQLLETESWAATSTELLEREEIRDALAEYLVGQIYANVDVEAEIAQVLPPQAQVLAGPASGALRQGAGEVARRALEDPRVQALWEDANRAAHEVFVRIVEGEGETVSTEGGVVTLDLAGIVDQIAERTGLPGDVAAKLPPDVAQLEIIKSDELDAAQDAVDIFETVAWILVGITLGLYAAAIWISDGRRREALRSVGISFVVVGVVLLLARNWAGDAVVDSLAEAAASEPAVAATWDVATSMLSEIAGASVIYGIGFIIAAWLAGPTAVATSTRRFAAPYLRQPRIAFGAAAVLLALVFWWSPTPGTERLIPSLLLIALVLLGTEMLRRRTIAEFPDRVTPYSAAGFARAMADQARSARAQRVRAAGQGAGPAGATERVDMLERLARLRDSGVLSAGEFEAEKARLLASSTPEQAGS